MELDILDLAKPLALAAVAIAIMALPCLHGAPRVRRESVPPPCVAFVHPHRRSTSLLLDHGDGDSRHLTLLRLRRWARDVPISEHVRSSVQPAMTPPRALISWHAHGDPGVNAICPPGYDDRMAQAFREHGVSLGSGGVFAIRRFFYDAGRAIRDRFTA